MCCGLDKPYFYKAMWPDQQRPGLKSSSRLIEQARAMLFAMTKAMP
jgi:hypothetical protein